MFVREHFPAIKWPVTPSNFGYSTPIQIHLLLIDNRTDISFDCPKPSEIMLVPPFISSRGVLKLNVSYFAQT